MFMELRDWVRISTELVLLKRKPDGHIVKSNGHSLKVSYIEVSITGAIEWR